MCLHPLSDVSLSFRLICLHELSQVVGAKYEKARISYEAAEERVALLKKNPGSQQQKIAKAKEESFELKDAFDDVQALALQTLRDTREKHDLIVTER